MRRLLRAFIAASILTLWIDALLWFDGDAGPVGWALSMAIPQLFLVPTVLVAALATWKKAWVPAGLSAAVALLQVFGPLGLCLGHASAAPADLRIVSYNIGQFEALHWPEQTRDALAETIRRLDPDVACLQEAHYHGRAYFADDLAKRLPNYHAYVEGGMMILSKRPFLRKETHTRESRYSGHWNVQEVAIRVSSRDVRLINVHMVPGGYEPPWWPRLPLLSQIERKRKLRDEEIKEIVRRVERESGPVAVCGDFNTQPFGPTYRRLSSVLTDGARATTAGFGYTLTARAPTKRIDYVWTRGLEPLRTWVGPYATSDHRPLVAEVRLPLRGRP